jgi:asparagine synthase (glutamine-hydrolysing)
MCGIFGYFNLLGNAVNPDYLEPMAHRLAHRGPDGYGVYHTGQLAFGAGRLAIIDLSAPAGPLMNEDRHVGVVFNGEIYNYKALRSELEQFGHQFATKTDTEVIVHGYEQWGRDVVAKLRGMFALCIWDEGEHRLILARDRAGEKPLYFTRIGDEFIFASEVKAFLEYPQFKPSVNRDALPNYLALGYVPAPQTMFAGVEKLFPGEQITVSREGISYHRYWRPTMAPVQPVKYEASVRNIRESLFNAVEMRLMSDVPVGAFLSGGVDSTAIVAIMSQLQKHPIPTFTVGFNFDTDRKNDDKFNVDARYATLAAEHFKTDHHSITIQQNQQLADVLPHLIYGMDDPVAQQSMFQSVYVSALARNHRVPVLLTGDGGDELFAGYPHFKADQTLARYLRIPRLLRASVITPLLERLPERYESAHKLAEKSQDIDPVNRYLAWKRVIDLDRFPTLLKDDRLAASGYNHVSSALLLMLTAPQKRPFADHIAYTGLSSWLAEDSNMRVDKTTMMMSIEARAPMEDHQLIDLSFSLPLSLKLKDGDFKTILKDAVADIVPKPILERPKWGFAPPISHWLRTHLRPLVEQYLAPDYVESVGIFKPEAVTALVNAHIYQGKYEVWALWTLLVFHMWYAIYIDGRLTLDHRLTPQELVTRNM